MKITFIFILFNNIEVEEQRSAQESQPSDAMCASTPVAVSIAGIDCDVPTSHLRREGR